MTRPRPRPKTQDGGKLREVLFVPMIAYERLGSQADGETEEEPSAACPVEDRLMEKKRQSPRGCSYKKSAIYASLTVERTYAPSIIFFYDLAPSANAWRY